MTTDNGNIYARINGDKNDYQVKLWREYNKNPRKTK